MAFCLLCRRRRQRNNHKFQRHPSHRARPSISRPVMQTNEQPLSPKSPPAAYYGAPRKHRYSAATCASISSFYRGLFDFERPGSENVDQKSVMSEIDRQILRGTGGGDTRSVSAGVGSAGSVGNANGTGDQAGRSSASLHRPRTPRGIRD